MSSAQPDKNRIKLIVAVAVIVLVIVVAIVIGAFLLAPKDDIRADISHTVHMYPSGEGIVHVSGVVYNDGDSDVNCTVHIRVFDGYIWHDYFMELGSIHAGGQHWFDWSANFLSMDEDNVQVEHTLIIG